MSIAELVEDLEALSEADLEELAIYISFLKFRSHFKSEQSLLDSAKLAELYAEFAHEDVALAEEDMADYYAALQVEDTRSY
jgi:hypothetical protein